MSEQELSELCRRHDNHARRRLYELYAGHMMAVCLRYVSDREVAQDLLHDGFLKIYASFDKFTYRGEGSLKAWLSRVIANMALEYLRKNNVSNHAIALEEAMDTDIGDNSTDEDVEEIPQEVLMSFINELPVGYRTVFNLYTFEEKSHKEIAEILSINEKSSASQLFRAKNALIKKIKEYRRKWER